MKLKRDTNWLRIFRKYVRLVGEVEGTEFLWDWDWSRKDWKAICEALHMLDEAG